MPDLPALDYAHGVSALDSGFVRPWLAAVHLIVEGDRAAIVDTATNACVPRVLAALAARGIAPQQVDWVMLTHIHLDHAGGAGLLMAKLPNARLTVHPRGARHMVDPGRLVEGTIAVYGEDYTRRLYGDIVPIPRERIVETPHGTRVSLGARSFEFFDTPGHARHHVVIRDGASGHVFTGDTFGLVYRELARDGRRFVFPSTSPVQFDASALHASVDLILGLAPDAVYVTHFGEVRDVARLGADMHRLVDAHVGIARACAGAGSARHERLVEGVRELVLAEACEQGWGVSVEQALEIFETDIELNAQGLGIWLDAQG